MLIGLGGGSGCGKTFFAGALQEKIGRDKIAVLDSDSYYNDLSHLSSEVRRRRNFDHPDAVDWGLLKNQLETISNGSAINKPVYDYKTHTRLDEAESIKPKRFVLVEGIMALVSREILEMYDLKIYLHLSADLRLMRRIRRDLKERRRCIEDILRQYEVSVRPMHQGYIAPLRNMVDLNIDLEKVSFNEAIDMCVKSIRDAAMVIE
jgi:uridine kinase